MNDTIIAVNDTVKFGLINLADQNWFSILIPFISAIAGGLLVLAGQWFERKHKIKLEIRNEVINILSFYSSNILIFNYQLKELAMHKFHVQYWWHCHITEIENEIKKSNYKKHLESQKLAFDTERDIYNTIGDLVKLRTKFETLIQEKLPVESLAYFEFEKAKTYDKNITHEELRYDMAEKDEQELRQKYFEKIIPFNNTYNFMQELFTKHYKE